MAAPFTVAKDWEEPSVAMADWCIHTVEYYIAIKRNEALPHATTWMNLKNHSE